MEWLYVADCRVKTKKIEGRDSGEVIELVTERL